MEGTNRLFLIMRDSVYRYCLYRISAPGVNEDESTICQLDKPLYMFEESVYPNCMSFTAVGSSIFIVGGHSRKGDNPVHPSSQTFIYDTLSDTLVQGPLLNGGKSKPHLFTIGAKIYALSRFVDCDEFKSSGMDPQPQFEVLDTENLGGGWSPLPVPRIRSAPKHSRKCLVGACVAAYVGPGTSSAIFVSFDGAGTYAFEVEKNLWSYVSAEKLPFSGDSEVIPPSPDCPYAPSLCCPGGRKGFRFHYYSNKLNKSDLFQIDEFEVDNSAIHSTPLPPRTFQNWSLLTFSLSGQVYHVTGGIDNADCCDTFIGNRYVKVTAMDICKVRCDRVEHEDETVKLESDKGLERQLLKRCIKKERKEMVDGEGEIVEVKKKMRYEKELDEKIKLELNQGQHLKRCNKKEREMGSGEEGDETIKLKMTLLWRRCFFAGPMCYNTEHVTAAFAM